MSAVVHSILPVAIFVAAGWITHRTGLLGEDFWAGIDRLVYFALLPALLLRTMSSVEATGPEVLATGAGVLVPMLTMTFLLVALRRLVASDGPAFSSVLQGALRVNAYIGLAVADSLMGTSGLGAFILVLAFVIPADNAISILGLVRYAGTNVHRGMKALRVVALNPLILSTVAGMTLAGFDVALAGTLDEVLRLAGAGALPLALLERQCPASQRLDVEEGSGGEDQHGHAHLASCAGNGAGAVDDTGALEPEPGTCCQERQRQSCRRSRA